MKPQTWAEQRERERERERKRSIQDHEPLSSNIKGASLIHFFQFFFLFSRLIKSQIYPNGVKRHHRLKSNHPIHWKAKKMFEDQLT